MIIWASLNLNMYVHRGEDHMPWRYDRLRSGRRPTSYYR